MDTTGLQRRRMLGVLGTGAGMGFLYACGGGGSDAEAKPPTGDPDPDPDAYATDLRLMTPENQAATFRNFDRLLPTRAIARGTQVLALPPRAGVPASLDAAAGTYMARNRTSGVLVLKGGEIALERYGMGSTPSSKWTSFSVAKSVTVTLLGAALRDGSIANLDDKLSTYVPGLGSDWGLSSVRDLLSMSSGMRWTEDYASASSDISALSNALGVPGAVQALVRTRPRSSPTGTVYNYSTAESYVLGAIVAAATGQNLSSFLSRKIWSTVGMESDAYWVLDATGGLEMGGNNLSATLRDHGRLGQFVLRQGVAGGQSVLPDGWRDLVSRPQTAQTAYGRPRNGSSLGYGCQWWSFPGSDGGFMAQGVYGQFLYINPAQDLVVVVLSAWVNTWNSASETETYALIDAAIQALR